MSKHSRLLDILKGSSLRTTMSDLEIQEVAEEIISDVEDLNNDNDGEIESLHNEISDLEDEVSDLKDEKEKLEDRVNELEKLSAKQDKTLNDVIAAEWVNQNWEWIVKLEQLNKSGKEIFDMVNGHEHVSRTLDNFRENVVEMIMNDEARKNVEHKRIILCGKAASGKDHMRKKLEEQGFKYAVSYTTRPKRDSEVHGIDYYFLTENEFKSMIEHDSFYEHISFNEWHYGTSNEQFFSDDVFIMTPSGISKLSPEDRKKSFIIYFDIDENVRRERLSLRSDADTVERRLEADTKDFENFTDFDIRVSNANF
jgi:guanylate kinase